MCNDCFSRLCGSFQATRSLTADSQTPRRFGCWLSEAGASWFRRQLNDPCLGTSQCLCLREELQRVSPWTVFQDSLRRERQETRLRLGETERGSGWFRRGPRMLCPQDSSGRRSADGALRLGPLCRLLRCIRAGFIPRQGRSCGRSCPPSSFSGKGGPRFFPLGVFRAFLSFLPLELQAGGLTWNQLWLSVC